ncbi:MAG: translation initiation factor IF-2 [Alphaproteobacteria bacterium]|nr:translation initiation factor IF-2 [Alphaproteobacteria bacterium]
MSDTEEKDDGFPCPENSKTLSLRRTFDSGLIRQNFPRGRSKSVIVEKKKQRVVVHPADKQADSTATSDSVGGSVALKVNSSVPKKSSEQTGAAIQGTLTEGEREARSQVLAEALARADRDSLKEELCQASHSIPESDPASFQLVEGEQAAAVAEKPEAKSVSEAPLPSGPAAGDMLPDTKSRSGIPAADFETVRKVSFSVKSIPKSPAKAPPKPAARDMDRQRRRSRLTISNAFNDESERARSMASIRRQRERARKQALNQDLPQKILREVVIPETIAIQELANRMAERGRDVINLLMKQGHICTLSDVIDADLAQLVAEEIGHSVRRVAESDVEVGLFNFEDNEQDLSSRVPVITIMGHVDHGKTSLLDALRETGVAAGEAGGITQHIGAYQLEVSEGKKITFIDTPGHAAFTAMRERGASVTDIVVVVVAADDGVKPQTMEAITHARSADVPIIVAISKIDKPEADVSRVRMGLLQESVVVESMGGDVIDVELSATKRLNLDKLLEMILLQSEMLDLKANVNRHPAGVVIEARLDRSRGPVTTLLVQHGCLRIGDIVVAGTEWGKVRALVDDRNVSRLDAWPSDPVEMLGFNSVPEAGDTFVFVESETRAREIADYRLRQKREIRALNMARARGNLEQMMTRLKIEGCQNMPLIVKGDSRGSIEAINGALEKMGNEEISARILHSGVGGIKETDISLAAASRALIIGFNVRAGHQPREMAERKGVDIRYYSVIYDVLDDMKQVMSGMLSLERRETFLGNAQIMEVFNITKVGKVAGCRVNEGRVERGAGVRLIRDDRVIHEGQLSSLKRFKDEVKIVKVGQECGMAFENYHEVQVGDIIECFQVEQVRRTLD